MSEIQTATAQLSLDEMQQYAANLYVGGKNSIEVKQALMERGLPENESAAIIEEFEQEITNARKGQAKKDMLYGALWCVGGLALTLADVGFIFWGAILFGGIQFFKGVSRLND